MSSDDITLYLKLAQRSDSLKPRPCFCLFTIIYHCTLYILKTIHPLEVVQISSVE